MATKKETEWVEKWHRKGMDGYERGTDERDANGYGRGMDGHRRMCKDIEMVQVRVERVQKGHGRGKKIDNFLTIYNIVRQMLC